jgi:glycosyltransferase involved in cell wall biosynthesis
MIWSARKAQTRNWEVAFIFPAMETPSVQRLIEAEQATVHIVSEPWGSSEGARAVAQCLTRLRPDIANFHFCDGIQILRVYLACHCRGIKVVAHYHGEIRPLCTLRWRNKHLSVLRLLSFFTHRIITVSYANKCFLKALNIRTPVEVVYNGIDVAAFQQRAACAELRTRATKNHALRFLYLGQIIDRKQVPVLIQAFALVRQQLPEARLTIIGNGPRNTQCRQLAVELGLGDSVKFVGLVSEFPFDHLLQSDIFVSASESESFGIVFAESMCLKLPVIACRVGGIPEVVTDQETGLLVPPRDPEALAAAMTTLARDPARCRQMGKAGHLRVVQHFDWSDKVDAIFDTFDRLLAPH